MRVLLTTALSLGLALAAASWQLREQRREASTDPQLVLRLVDAALAPDAAVEIEWSVPEELAAERALLDDEFPAELGDWTYLASPGEHGGMPPGSTHSRLEARPRFVRIPGGRGVLLRTVPVEPQQFIQVDARLRAQLADGALEPDDELRQCRLIVLPLNQAVDARELLAGRTVTELWEDPRREFLCLGKPPPNYESDAFTHSDTFRHHRTVFQVPRDARSLLLAVWTGEASYRHVDVRRISVQPLSARRAAGLGGVPDDLHSQPPEQLAVHGKVHPGDPTSYGLHRFPPALDHGEAGMAAALRTIDCLGERRDGFLLPPPARLAFDLQLPSGPLVLEFGRAVLHERRPRWRVHDATLELGLRTEDGARTVLHQEELRSTDPTGWIDRSVDLSAWAGQRVRLDFATDSLRTEDLVAVGAPLVRRRAPLDPRPNVILVSLDTLRVDRLSCEGHDRATTPQLDALARENLWFRQAHSTSSYTLPSHASMMTGQLPSLHGAIAPVAGQNRLSRRRSETLAEKLRDAGYLTAAFTGGNYVGANYGFGRGFDRYSDLDPLLSSAASWWNVTPVVDQRRFNLRHRQRFGFDAALDWIGEHRDGRFFVFLHTYHVHEYQPSQEQRERFLGDRPDAKPERFLAWKGNKTRDARTMSDEDLALGSDLYDATLADADAMIGRLVSFLQDRRLWEDTLLIVTSDHGEEFLEHGRLGHGRSLDQIQLRIPLILHLPGERRAAEIHEAVSLIDLMPTVLDVLDLEEALEVQGRSLKELWLGAAESEPVFAELALTAEQHFTAVVDGRDKLAMRGTPVEDPQWPPPGARAEAGDERLYDLEEDPAEADDLAARQPDRVVELRELARRRIGAADRRRQELGEDVARPLTQKEIEQLRLLGYDTSELPASSERPPSGDDPSSPVVEDGR